MITFCKTDSKPKYDWFEWTLIGFVILTSILYILISGKRSFNFDEFQVLYASAALLRGKALYADRIGVHFPLVNILYSILIYLGGFKAAVMLAGRYFIFCINGITLCYIYRIGCFLWNKKTGIMAVILTLVTVTFMQRGIEIRHDVFNTMFNVVGAYYALKYLNREKYLYLLLSGLFCGLAVASTQKAMVWSVGIISGVIFHFLRIKSYKKILRAILTYTVIILLPLVVCVIYLILVNNESLISFYKHSLSDIIIGFSPHTPTAYPFPHSRYGLLKILFSQNPLFYAIGIGGIVWLGIFWIRNGSEKIVLISWTTIGLLFYLTVKRPFYQSLLPTIPPLAIVASAFLVWIEEKIKEAQSYKKWIGGMLCTFFLFVWPFYFISKVAYRPSTIGRQIDNVDFCIDALKTGDKVMCLSQNQIFFDPVLTIEDKDCGKNLFHWGDECFEKKMIKAQCKIVIYDYRTSLLNEHIQNIIKNNYVYTKIGEILIPGFKIPPKKLIEKNIWIDGYYYTLNSSLLIDGNKVNGNLFRLTQKRHTIYNLSDKTILLVYIFNAESAIKDNSLLDTYIHNMF
jgi:hypothetical protein